MMWYLNLNKEGKKINLITRTLPEVLLQLLLMQLNLTSLLY